MEQVVEKKADSNDATAGTHPAGLLRRRETREPTRVLRMRVDYSAMDFLFGGAPRDGAATVWQARLIPHTISSAFGSLNEEPPIPHQVRSPLFDTCHAVAVYHIIR